MFLKTVAHLYFLLTPYFLKGYDKVINRKYPYLHELAILCILHMTQHNPSPQKKEKDKWVTGLT